ncbi:hypothetical protein SDC9_97160 [bioreactor metagenome]|uniref:Uncharacterized protein n=1 Tax=bioreactor metagenome TaxID=1076179 RepID=A0A645ADR3_9ZZZZ
MCGDLIGIHIRHRNCSVNRVGERIRHRGIYRQQQVHALLFGLFHHVFAIIHLFKVDERRTHLVALGREEGVRHAAADDQRIHLAQQIVDDVQLIGHLGAAQNGDKRAHGAVDGIAKELDLLAHQVTHRSGFDIIGHTDSRAVGTVRRAKRVVDIHVGKAGQLFAECGLVFGLFFAEAGILQQHHVAVFHCGNGGLCMLAHNGVIIGKHDRLAQQLCQTRRARSEAELRLRAVFRLAQMAAKDNLAAVCNQLFNGRQGRDDAVIVGDDAVLHRDVEIYPDKNALALYVNIVNCFFAKSAHTACTPFLVSELDSF